MYASYPYSNNSPPQTYQFPAHLLTTQNLLVNQSSSHQTPSYEAYKALMNGIANSGYPVPTMNCSVYSNTVPAALTMCSTVYSSSSPHLSSGGINVVNSVLQSSSNIPSDPSRQPAVISTLGSNIPPGLSQQQAVSTKPSSSVSSSVGQSSKISISIENTCLSFIRSMLFRVARDEVIALASTNFGLSELKEAREVLFKLTGSKSYRYQGPKEPASQHDKSSHCSSSIVLKIEELSKSSLVVKFSNSAEDLYRLVKMMECERNSSEETSRRIQSVEKDVKYLMSLPHNINSATVPTPRFIPAQDNRQNLLKSFDFPSLSSVVGSKSQSAKEFSTPVRSKGSHSNTRNNTPSKRRRFDSIAKASANSPSSAPSSPAWKTVQKKRRRPEVEHVPKGRPPPASKSHEIFLFRYDNDETPSSVLKYFKDVGITSAHHVRYCCSPHAPSKSFVMKFRNLDEFKLIVRNLPDYTGCRPYRTEPLDEDEERPRGYFNYGGNIRGPNVEELLEDGVPGDDCSHDMDATDIPAVVMPASESAPFTNDSVATAISKAMSAPTSNTSLVAVVSSPSTSTGISIASGVSGLSIITSSADAGCSSSSHSEGSTDSTPPVTSDNSNVTSASNIKDSIKPLQPVDSPHLRTSSIGYEHVVSEL